MKQLNIQVNNWEDIKLLFYDVVHTRVSDVGAHQVNL